ncbi:MAG: FAD:protein FMN transferase [Planctomycetota bacterium]
MLAALLLSALPQGASPSSCERRVAAMGTAFDLVLTARDRATALLASEAAVRAVEAAEERLSTWIETSELARLNGAPVGAWCALSAELEADLSRAREFHVWTGGAFDPGLAALVHAWGLRSGGRTPEAAELAAARAAGGLRAFEFEPGRARRLHPAAGIEEGGFGKGLALDQALAALLAAGGTSARLDLGGQVLFDLPAAEELWLADPRERARPVLALTLRTGSLATSGNGERGIVVDGVRRGHLLDPRTGEPAPDFGSLSVLAPAALQADALSTGFFVLGPEEAFRRAAAAPELALVVLEPAGQFLRARVSAGLRGRVRVLVDDLTLEFVAAPSAANASSSQAR